MRRIVVATGNPGKLEEIRRLLASTGAEVLSLKDFPGLKLPPETGLTFMENALSKARYVSAHTSAPALADDSGLAVDALGGRPGILSARYSGEGATDRDNYLKLLGELEGVPPEERKARFVCALAYVEPGGLEKTFEGTLEGVIADEPRGAGGFGYDPVFFLPERGKTVAELKPWEKDSISHRGKALRKFGEWLTARGR